MPPLRSKSAISIGFMVIALLFFAVIAIWITTVASNKTSVRRVSESETRQHLIFTMRDASHQRNLSLFRMAALRDSFERDAEFLQFKQYAVDFIIARDELLKDYANDKITNHWQNIKSAVHRSESIQNTIVDRILDGKNKDALELIQKDFIPSQREVSIGLTKMLTDANGDIEANLEDTVRKTQGQYYVILFLALIASALGYIIAKSVLRRTDEAEQLLITKKNQLQTLHEVISLPGDNFAKRIQQILQLGCDFFQCECGAVLLRAGNSVTVSHRYSAKSTADFPEGESDLINLYNDIALTKTSVSRDNDEHFKNNLEATHKLHGYETIGTPLAIYDNSDALVVFLGKEPIPPHNDNTEMLQLVASNITLLLDRIETSEQLARAKAAAETANKTKSAFLTNISQELRTPLHTIIGYGEMMKEKAEQNHHSLYHEELDMIGSASQQLFSLISNLLDLSQLEADNMPLNTQSVDIQALLEEVESVQKAVLEQNANQYSSQMLNELGTINTDPSKLNQVLTSVLGYAGRSTDKGLIELTAWREQSPEGDWLYIEIKDSGNGISKKQLNHLFKLGTETANVNHVAIELAIAKRIFEKLGGDILLESKPDQGSIFTLCLPCRSEIQQERQSMGMQ